MVKRMTSTTWAKFEKMTILQEKIAKFPILRCVPYIDVRKENHCSHNIKKT